MRRGRRWTARLREPGRAGGCWPGHRQARPDDGAGFFCQRPDFKAVWPFLRIGAHQTAKATQMIPPRLCSKPRRLPTLTALWGVGRMSFGSRGPRAPCVFWRANTGPDGRTRVGANQFRLVAGWPASTEVIRPRRSPLQQHVGVSAELPSRCRRSPPKRNFCSRASAGFAPHVRYSREASILNTHCCGAAFHANLSGLAPCTVRAYLVPWVNLLRPAASEKEGFL